MENNTRTAMLTKAFKDFLTTINSDWDLSPEEIDEEAKRFATAVLNNDPVIIDNGYHTGIEIGIASECGIEI